MKLHKKYIVLIILACLITGYEIFREYISVKLTAFQLERLYGTKFEIVDYDKFRTSTGSIGWGWSTDMSALLRDSNGVYTEVIINKDLPIFGGQHIEYCNYIEDLISAKLTNMLNEEYKKRFKDSTITIPIKIQECCCVN